MKIIKPAMAGTLESSDAQISIEPGEGKIDITIQSNVLGQYGKQIRQTVLDTLAQLAVESARVTVVDKGALDCTLRARTECAVYRASGQEQPVQWGGAHGES